MTSWCVLSRRLPALSAPLPPRSAWLPSRRDAVAAARALDVVSVWIARIEAASRWSRPAVTGYEELEFKAVQLSLFGRTCQCGETFYPARRGRPPKACPACQAEARRQFFRAKANARKPHVDFGG